MKESAFIKLNQDSWKKFEEFLDGHVSLTPDELGDYYIRITEDLAYAHTFYPNSKLIDYLNKLAVHSHQFIYKSKRESKSRIKSFFTNEVPLAVYKSRKELFISLVVFSVAIAIGFFSALKDDRFPNLILGDRYVNMTINNIEKGDPMGVYGGTESGPMFFSISSNNIRVSFLAFVIGIFSSVLTGLLLLYNGVMVGAFMTFFISRGLGWLSFSTIMIHGTLELSAIVIAGGAGMVIGNAWLFPGTYGRMYNLRKASRTALKIIAALIPVFIIAAVLESYVTRLYVELGSVGRSLVIIISLIFIVWYFGLYPYIVKNEEIKKNNISAATHLR